MLNIEKLASDHYPQLDTQPRLIRQPLVALLKDLFHEDEINAFLDQHQDLGPLEFVDQVLERFQFSYQVAAREKQNIPAEGRVVIVANHPIGSLDGLVLLKLVSEIRPDVKVVANELLWQLKPLRPLLLPVDNLSSKGFRQTFRQVTASLENEEAVIIFPAGEVSRMTAKGIRDCQWQKGFVHFARKTNSPLLPVHLDYTNSALFYSLSMIYKPLGGLLLVREMFRKHRRDLPVRIGELIPLEHFDLPGLPVKTKVKLLRKQVYRLPTRKSSLFVTSKTLAHPENPQAIKQELQEAECLGQTEDGWKIFLADYRPDSALLREIGRLRELTFRRVGEGTGQRRDIDHYDRHYQQLVLWNEESLEIVGAYRLAETGPLVKEQGLDGLYSSSLFKHQRQLLPCLEKGVELGRSFVQPKYWGRRSLDYLWQGIGAYLRSRPQLQWMLGPVSISNALPPAAKDLLVIYYRYYYGQTSHLSLARAPYMVSEEGRKEALRIFGFQSCEEDFKTLKKALAFYGVTVPTLYKHYTGLCETGGAHFLDFNVDAYFSYCIDGLVLVETAQIKQKKKQRYLRSL
ncbi:lysophospholipid acyltransferase family protein [Marinospirillum perlucidum]|uniref:lysophospholipid acyltransferase family protein n=1 Tax=Marinospirillum perlucidum TaxID=1982602 RepID=UPI000DF1E80D|nr:lysophospholipid acyltransferase family protein [Marinospirillum perlucidum]